MGADGDQSKHDKAQQEDPEAQGNGRIRRACLPLLLVPESPPHVATRESLRSEGFQNSSWSRCCRAMDCRVDPHP